MRIISYRGPAGSGGVTSALSQLFKSKYPQASLQLMPSEWWFLKSKGGKNELVGVDSILSKEYSFTMDETLVALHYRYCNNYLWPIFHDLPQYASLDQIERESYKTFNAMLAFQLRKMNESSCSPVFVNDYQLALVPQTLKNPMETLCFWHIPWPKHVSEEHMNDVCEIAIGLLHCNQLGFHTQEYRHNFLTFVANQLPQFHVDSELNCVRHKRGSTHSTTVVVAPLAIDSTQWKSLSWAASSGSFHREFTSYVQQQQTRLSPRLQSETPYILSVDRADYTKGVLERLCAIDQFFESYPQYVRKTQFVQLVTRTRPGLPAFDKYWKDCLSAQDEINRRWRQGRWKPILWIHKPRKAADLAALYRHADMMIVSPLRDGLNLTAKEYIACQTSLDGVLALSQGAGVFSEFGEHAIKIDSSNPIAFANSIAEGLSLSAAERYRRMRLMTNVLNSQSLLNWWYRISANTCDQDVLDMSQPMLLA